MNRFIPVMIFASLSLVVNAQELKVFKDARSAIGAAKQQDKHIVFFLWDARDSSHLTVAESLKEELGTLSDEFVLVNLAHSVKANRDLFNTRFGKDLSRMPIAVVSNASGEKIKSYQGTRTDGYERMLISARIEGGRITDPVALANLKESLEKVGEKGGGFLAPMVKDLNVKKVAITKMRTWTKSDGTTFEAILLEALGAEGVFVDAKGGSTKVQFIELSPDDIEFLKTRLAVQKPDSQ